MTVSTVLFALHIGKMKFKHIKVKSMAAQRLNGAGPDTLSCGHHDTLSENFFTKWRQYLKGYHGTRR